MRPDAAETRLCEGFVSAREGLRYTASVPQGFEREFVHRPCKRRASRFGFCHQHQGQVPLSRMQARETTTKARKPKP